MSEENESSLPALLIGLIVIVAVLAGGFYWVVTKRQEQMTLAESEAREAALRALPPIVADASFEFQLGQGSGQRGLNLIKITGDGNVVYDYGLPDDSWGRKEFSLDKQAIEGLIAKINMLRVGEMANEYIDRNVQDGEQWCLLIRSGGHAKSIYCSNQFPERIKELASYVHNSIIDKLGKNAKAVTVLEQDHDKHERELWESIK